MHKVGEFVYHTGVEANGIIHEVDETKRDPYRLVFPWAKYCEIKHGAYRGMRRPDRKWMWCRDNMLVSHDLGNVQRDNREKKVTMNGGRSLDKLIRHVTGIPRYRRGDGSDVVINYGNKTNDIPNNVRVINRNLMSNKYQQMKAMGEGLCPQSTRALPHNAEGWIVKPSYSIGGKGIYRYKNDVPLNPGDYFQKEFNKVREFRAHCFMWEDNKVPFIQEKVCKEPDQLTWNKKQGGKFRYVYQENLTHGKYIGLDGGIRERISDMSISALRLIGYDFGGLDFGMDANGELKIFEVNSRMGLRERSLYTYIRAFDMLKYVDLGG